MTRDNGRYLAGGKLRGWDDEPSLKEGLMTWYAPTLPPTLFCWVCTYGYAPTGVFVGRCVGPAAPTAACPVLTMLRCYAGTIRCCPGTNGGTWQYYF
eukprot:3817341-Rhodomonas_salina.4